jgi:hypothetical protein
MTKTLPSLDGLIEYVREQTSAASELDRVRDAVHVAGTIGELGDHLVGHFIDEARTAGYSWSAIGEYLGLSRQAVQKRYAPPAGEEPTKRPGLFDRMVPEGKFAIVHAQDAARARQADYISGVHLLLGIADEPECAGAKALGACGATPEIVTAAINGRIGKPTGKPRTEKLPFTPRAKKILENSLRESLRLGHDYVGTEHLALSFLTVPDAMSGEILRNLGVTYDGLRDAIAAMQ